MKIGDNVARIGNYAFYGCTSLTSVTISNGVKTIGIYAFAWCTSLTSVVISNEVKTISIGAFGGCTSLSSVYYTGTVSEWSDISIDSTNTELTLVMVYYYAENGSMTEAGNYWYYDTDGSIKTWSVE